MPSSKSLRELRERFFPKKIEVNIDGQSEVWEYEKYAIGESEMFITYKLKKTGNYETGI